MARRATGLASFFITFAVVWTSWSMVKEVSQAFAAPPSTTSSSAFKQQQQPKKLGKGLTGHRAEAVSQLALPPKRIGAYQPSIRPRFSPRQKLTDMKASFTQMVVDVAVAPRVLLGEIAVIVILSMLFEKGEHKLRAFFKKSGRETAGEIMNTLFKEITVLGFVAFAIFIFTHTGFADTIAPMILKDGSFNYLGHNPLSATFETVHMIVFFLLVVLLAQAAAMYFVSEQICARWGGYERTVSYGGGRATLETKLVDAGFITRARDDSEPRGVKLSDAKPFAYGSNWLSRLMMRSRPMHKLLMWRAIRHEFLFPATPVVEGKKAAKVPDPALFSMEEYFRSKLGKVVLGLIHVDKWAWVVTMGIAAIPLFLGKYVTHIPHEAVHCILAWSIALVGMVLAVALERDTYKYTPKIPKSGTDILKLFSGESFQMLRRGKLPGWKEKELQSDDAASRAPLELPEAMTKKEKGLGFYKLVFRVLSFVQAVSFTGLILSHLTSPFAGRAEWAWYVAAALEWPFFLFVIVPVIIRRLTIRSSISEEKDQALINKVTTNTKESLVRDYARLVLIQGFERRAAEKDEAWTKDEGEWDTKQAVQTVLKGLKKFDKMPEVEKREIWALFASWDTMNNGSVDPRELIETFKSMGCDRAELAVDNIVRMVDFDDSSSINWMKFKAIYGLATTERTEEEMKEDFTSSFEFFDANNNQELSIFELAEGFKKMNVGISLDDIANLLFVYFGAAKPTITMDEFVEWVVADRKASLLAASK